MDRGLRHEKNILLDTIVFFLKKTVTNDLN